MTGFWLVFLTVLKVIGFVLLGIIAFVLFIILLVCLVPVRYDGHVKYEEKANGFFRITWLLHAVSAGVILKDNKPELRIRILGFIKIGEKKKETPDSEQNADTSGKTDAAGGTAGDEPEKIEVSSVKNEGAGKEEKSGSESAEQTEKNGENAEEKVNTGGKAGRRPGFLEFYSEKLEQLEAFLTGKYEEILQKIKVKTVELKEKYADLKDKKDFFTQPRVLAAVKHVLKLVLKLLKTFRPRKIKGKAVFGLDSPADTGKYYGMICAAYPIHRNRIEVTPVFDHREIKADVKMRGRIVIGCIVAAAVRMILNRDVIYTLKNIKKHI